MDWKAAGLAAWRVARWLFKAALFAAVLLALLVVAAAMREHVDFGSLDTRGANAWLMGLGLAGVGALLFFAFRSLARLFFSSGPWQLFGRDPVARLIALGIVAFFSPGAVLALVKAPVTIVVELANQLPQIVKQLVEYNVQTETVPLEMVLARAAWVVETAGLDLSRAAARLFELMPVPQVIVALALWAVLGQLFSAAGDSQAGTKRMQALVLLRRLWDRIHGLDERQQRIASLAVIFLGGIYLSTAAIVAIPWLDSAKGAGDFTRDKLEKALQPLIPSGKEQDPGLTPVSASAAQADSIRSLLEQTQQRIAHERSVKQIPLLGAPDVLEELNRSLGNANQERARAAFLWTRLRDDFVASRGRMLADALAAFDSATAVPVNSQERAFFFHSIQRSAREHLNSRERALRACGRAINDTDQKYASTASEVASRLKGADAMTPPVIQPVRQRLRELEDDAAAAMKACSSPVADWSLEVEASEPGADWGPFALVAQWLLKTRSQELALITGMFGFGLLGSAVVTFVRPRTGRSVAQVELGTVAGEVASIIARGLSAAIVVFLAVKGGLAVFSGGETEPNAYVLFFTCLVGAVFSEVVWEAARKKLGETLPSAAKSTAPAAKPARGRAAGKPKAP